MFSIRFFENVHSHLCVTLNAITYGNDTIIDEKVLRIEKTSPWGLHKTNHHHLYLVFAPSHIPPSSSSCVRCCCCCCRLNKCCQHTTSYFFCFFFFSYPTYTYTHIFSLFITGKKHNNNISRKKHSTASEAKYSLRG